MDPSTSTSETSENVFLFVFISLFVSFGVCFYVWSWKWNSNRKYILELIKRRSKVHQENMSPKHGLNFDQWKSFFENFEPVRGWSWLVYKIGENNCCLRLFVYLSWQN